MRISILILSLLFSSYCYADYYDGLKAYDNGDYQTALKLFRKDGSADSMNGIGLIYRYGNGASKNYSEAIKWFKKSADLGKEKSGKVTVKSLGLYSKEKTTEISTKLGHPQTPFIINFGRDNPLFEVR